MAEQQFSIAEKYRNTDTSDEKVYLTVSGTCRRPWSDGALNALEQTAYSLSFNPRGRAADVEFIVSLPADWDLTFGEAQRVDAAIFRGLIERGRKGNWSRLDKYPPSKDYPE